MNIPSLRIVFFLSVFCIASSFAIAEEASDLSLRDGDRVAIIGGTFVEREQQHGYLELALHLANPGIRFGVRNLGWSGDTVKAESRGRFGDQQEGFAHLMKSVDLVDPTVILLCYGTNEAFDPEQTPEQFRKDYLTLLGTLEKRSSRIVLITPPRIFNVGSPLPDPSKYNARLGKFSDVVKKLAYDRGYGLIDLDEVTKQLSKEPVGELTANGQHFTAEGYRKLALIVAKKQKWSLPVGLSFQAKDLGTHSPVTLPLVFPAREGSILLSVRDVGPGKYQVALQDEAPTTPTHDKWQTGVEIPASELIDRTENLRQAILRKNQLFFDRYRPQNETYLYLFRKHEQGNNAVEIPKFDPLIQSQDQQIHELKQPVSSTLSFQSAN